MNLSSKKLVDPIVVISPSASCAKCGSTAVAVGRDCQRIWAERKAYERDDPDDPDRIRKKNVWKSEAAVFTYVHCTECYWTILTPVSSNIIGSEGYYYPEEQRTK